MRPLKESRSQRHSGRVGVATGRGGESLMDSEFRFCEVSVKAVDTGDSERPHACHRTLHVKMVLVNILILCILLQM